MSWKKIKDAILDPFNKETMPEEYGVYRRDLLRVQLTCLVPILDFSLCSWVCEKTKEEYYEDDGRETEIL